MNTAPARSVSKKGVPGLGPWARSRTGPGPARTSYLHGSTRLARVYKSSVERKKKKEEERRKNKEESRKKKEGRKKKKKKVKEE